MEPLYFGPAARRLFGAYEPPRGRARDAGVVVCNAGVQEYTRAHFAVRRLAGAIAAAGYHVLRFDWSGTGDSAGDLGEATAGRWCEDVRAAAAELRELSGARRLSLVGYRLGALLAARAAGDGLELRDLVLWDPPVDGREHLTALDAAERAHRAALGWVRMDEDQLHGYPFPARLRSSVEALDLRTVNGARVERIDVFAPPGAPVLAAGEAILRDRAGRPPTLTEVIDPEAPPEAAFLPTRSIRAIADRLGEAR